MKKMLILVCMLLFLSACRTSLYTADGSRETSDSAASVGHSHGAFEGNNVVEHDTVGYCGNTITTVRCAKMGGQEENWERSFWGGTSVGLTDLLRWLHYAEEVCRCLPEYYIKTEFGASEYGLNLSEGYVRYEGRQTQLTEEQVEQLQSMIDEVASGKADGICSLPPAERPYLTQQAKRQLGAFTSP